MTSSRKFTRQPGADQIAEWKRAIAEHSRQQRSKRGKRPAKPIVGVVLKPDRKTP